ncbi:hypothetical protein N9D31_02050 [Oligoflexaceae bacterium]|nr:hypothetical protein [Oligoflexaceae bacterium]
MNGSRLTDLANGVRPNQGENPRFKLTNRKKAPVYIYYANESISQDSVRNTLEALNSASYGQGRAVFERSCKELGIERMECQEMMRSIAAKISDDWTEFNNTVLEETNWLKQMCERGHVNLAVFTNRLFLTESAGSNKPSWQVCDVESKTLKSVPFTLDFKTASKEPGAAKIADNDQKFTFDFLPKILRNQPASSVSILRQSIEEVKNAFLPEKHRYLLVVKSHGTENHNVIPFLLPEGKMETIKQKRWLWKIFLKAALNSKLKKSDDLNVFEHFSGAMKGGQLEPPGGDEPLGPPGGNEPLEPPGGDEPLEPPGGDEPLGAETKGFGIEKTEFISVLKDASRDMFFSLVFMESCNSDLSLTDGNKDSKLPREQIIKNLDLPNVGVIFGSIGGLQWKTLDYRLMSARLGSFGDSFGDDIEEVVVRQLESAATGKPPIELKISAQTISVNPQEAIDPVMIYAYDEMYGDQVILSMRVIDGECPNIYLKGQTLLSRVKPLRLSSSDTPYGCDIRITADSSAVGDPRSVSRIIQFHKQKRESSGSSQSTASDHTTYFQEPVTFRIDEAIFVDGGLAKRSCGNDWESLKIGYKDKIFSAVVNGSKAENTKVLCEFSLHSEARDMIPEEDVRGNDDPDLGPKMTYKKTIEFINRPPSLRAERAFFAAKPGQKVSIRLIAEDEDGDEINIKESIIKSTCDFKWAEPTSEAGRLVRKVDLTVPQKSKNNDFTCQMHVYAVNSNIIPSREKQPVYVPITVRILH